MKIDATYFNIVFTGGGLHRHSGSLCTVLHKMDRTEWTNTNQPRPNGDGIFYFHHPNILVCPKSNHHIFDQILDIYNTKQTYYDQVSWCLFVAWGIQELILIKKKLSTEYRMPQQQRSINCQQCSQNAIAELMMMRDKKHPCTSRLTLKAIHKQKTILIQKIHGIRKSSSSCSWIQKNNHANDVVGMIVYTSSSRV